MLQGLGCFKFSTYGFCVVRLCQGKTDGKDFFAFVAIEPQNYRYFVKRYRDGELSNFAPYGFELLRGWGTEPPEAVTDYIRNKHGVEFGVSESFLNRMIANIDPAAKPLDREYYINLATAHA